MTDDVIVENVAEFMQNTLNLDGVGYDAESVWYTGKDGRRRTLGIQVSDAEIRPRDRPGYGIISAEETKET